MIAPRDGMERDLAQETPWASAAFHSMEPKLCRKSRKICPVFLVFFDRLSAMDLIWPARL
jgi:hypothetical protein